MTIANKTTKEQKDSLSYEYIIFAVPITTISPMTNEVDQNMGVSKVETYPVKECFTCLSVNTIFLFKSKVSFSFYC